MERNATALCSHLEQGTALPDGLIQAVRCVAVRRIRIRGRIEFDQRRIVLDGGGIVQSSTNAIDLLSEALAHINAQRARIGAQQNRLEHTVANEDNIVENTTAAESRLRDTDIAEAMVEYSKNNILRQAGQSMLAQSFRPPGQVLRLLQ